eukprot:TRINITY_DN7469_c0_g1_i2.p2 TRINITY_DN7469_c0_g1~~TRINITY_DN7469_c0_g1_i2.p2  ORF type:complete len:295 (+),score=44.89 TRINITY_DN7469_c0_g1_i2:1902-2786(+)
MDASSVLALLNEVCARKGRDELRESVGTDEDVVTNAGRKRVAAFLGISNASAPEALPVEEAEPPQADVRRSCCSDVKLDQAKFDFVAWVREVIRPWLSALTFISRLRAVLEDRPGGWAQLARDMEAGRSAYDDVCQALCVLPSADERSPAFWLGVDSNQLSNVFAGMAAQAFLHHSSQLRRVAELGGVLSEPLQDVRERLSLQSMAVDVRMAIYKERVAAKMQEWRRVGTDLTVTRARACDIGQYANMCGSHVHGLTKQAFWGLWYAAKRDGHNGEKVREFLKSANQGFVQKYG